MLLKSQFYHAGGGNRNFRRNNIPRAWRILERKLTDNDETNTASVYIVEIHIMLANIDTKYMCLQKKIEHSL